MSKRITTLVVALVLAAPATAAAQFGPLQLGVGAGPSFPAGHFADEASPGFHVTATLGLDLPLLPIDLRGDFIWQRFPDRIDGNFDGIGGFLNATYTLLRLPLGRTYLVGGVGMLRWEEPTEDHGDHAHEGDHGTDFAFNVGAGIGISLMGMTGFIEARYLDAGEHHRGVPVTLGLRF